jgi:hypothetical protein
LLHPHLRRGTMDAYTRQGHKILSNSKSIGLGTRLEIEIDHKTEIEIETKISTTKTSTMKHLIPACIASCAVIVGLHHLSAPTRTTTLGVAPAALTNAYSATCTNIAIEATNTALAGLTTNVLVSVPTTNSIVSADTNAPTLVL